MKNLILVLSLVFVSNILSAQLYFKNNTDQPVYVAIAQWNDSKSEDHWFSKGWFKIDPGDNKEIMPAIGLNDKCYYYAHSEDHSKVYEGNTPLLVHKTDAFTIKNADKEYQKKSNENYEWKKFRKFTYDTNLMGTKVKQTIVLNY